MKANTSLKSIGVSHIALALFLAAAPNASAQNYHYSRVGPEGTVTSRPIDINSAGTIIGSIRPPASSSSFAFVKPRGGDFARFTIPGTRSVVLNSINSQGTVVGSLTELNRTSHTFIANADASDVRILPLIDGVRLAPSGISANGQVFGSITLRDPQTFEALSQWGVIVDTRHADAVTYVGFPDPDLPFTSVISGNNRGMVIGSAHDEDFTEYAYFTARRGDFADFAFPDMIFTDVSDINNQGDVLAYYVSREDGKFHPFIRAQNGKVVELVAPEIEAQVVQEYPATMVRGGTTYYRADSAIMMLPTGINDRGDVVGFCGIGYSHLQNPFPLDPVTLPMFWSFGNSRGFLAEKAGDK